MGEVGLVQGNEACARAAIAAGVRFFGGYPITPSTEIAEELARELPLVGGRFIQMEDEIASMAAVIGASLGGVKAMTATSGPGFSLKQENIGYAAMTEVPCVIVNVQRVGPSTGSPTAPAQGDVMQARWGTHGDHPIVVLCPWSVSETYDVTIEAVNISERLRTPVIVLLDEVVGHMRERFVEPDPLPAIVDRSQPSVAPDEYIPFRPPPGSDVPELAAFGTGYRVAVTGLCHNEWGRPTTKPDEIERLITRLHNKVETRREELAWYRVTGDDDPDTLVVAYGATARAAARAVTLARAEGRRVRMFRPISLWPYPGAAMIQALAGATRVIVPEMNLGQLSLEIERWLPADVTLTSIGRVTSELMRPGEILTAIMEVSA